MNRNGKSLIELLFVIAATGALLVVVGQTLSSVLRADSSQAAASRRLSASAGLAERFRKDAHAATSATLKTGKEMELRSLIFQLPDGGTATYEVADKVHRTLHQNDKRLALEGWPLNPASVHMKLEEEGRLAVLIIRMKDNVATTPAIDDDSADAVSGLRVEARIGFDHRLVRTLP